MQLDDVIATTSPDHARIAEATHRSIRWLDRCGYGSVGTVGYHVMAIKRGGEPLLAVEKSAA